MTNLNLKEWKSRKGGYTRVGNLRSLLVGDFEEILKMIQNLLVPNCIKRGRRKIVVIIVVVIVVVIVVIVLLLIIVVVIVVVIIVVIVVIIVVVIVIVTVSFSILTLTKTGINGYKKWGILTAVRIRFVRLGSTLTEVRIRLARMQPFPTRQDTMVQIRQYPVRSLAACFARATVLEAC